MSTLLYYDNKQILNNFPTPSVARQESMIRAGERWAEQTLITLNGNITGCIKNGYNDLIAAQQQLINVFAKDFQEFKIVEDNNVIYSAPYSIIKGGVQFDSSNYAGLIGYKVTLECYHQHLFSGYYGVLDPRDTWNFEESNDRRLTITHNVGARGFNTSSGNSNGLSNAKAFVQTRTGMPPTVYPSFINFGSGMYPCLKTVKENLDRFNGIYSIDMIYEADLYYNQPGILRYTSDFICNAKNGLSKVSINGNVEACFDEDVDDLRARYASFNIFDAALEAYQEATDRVDLNEGYLSSGVAEDPYHKTLNFNVEFDNFSGSNTFFDYKVNINSGDNDVVSAQINGTISARGDQKSKWQRVSGYYSSGIDLYGLANSDYVDFGGAGSLNVSPLSSGVSFDKFNATIGVNASWDNKTVDILGFQNLDYSVSYVPPLQRVVARPLATNLAGGICEDSYYVLDLNHTNRINYTIQGEGQMVCGYNSGTAIANLKTYFNTLFHTECPQTRVLLEDNKIGVSTNSIQFLFSWSAESSGNVIVPKSNYNFVNSLSL